uniref:YncE family protein n=1 Tax=Rhodococcus marinonascens TaxID=38311 RepID=UPI000A96E89D
FPVGVAVTPDGTRAYVTNVGDGTVSVIDTATNTVVETVPVGAAPQGVAITPDGSRAYVANLGDNTVSVIGIDRCTGSLCLDFGSGTGSGSGWGSFFS